MVGLAIARKLALLGRQVVLFEAERATGMHTSSRNSEVLHAGIYYPTGSLKARLCVEGRRMLQGYCQGRGITWRRIGKIVVASSEAEIPMLEHYKAQGHTNGVEELAWLEREVAKAPRDRPLLVFAHRPLFPLAQPWDWFTQDGERALEILDGHPSATVFYGHIHQAHIHKTRTTLHLATRSLVFPMPAPMSVEKKAPLPWDPAAADHGLGYRGIAMVGADATWLDRPLVS